MPSHAPVYVCHYAVLNRPASAVDRAGVDLLIATPAPARLHEQGHLVLDQSDLIVLDEADQMFDWAFSQP
jgi:superfamily II DNA/RNA helicase